MGVETALIVGATLLAAGGQAYSQKRQRDQTLRAGHAADEAAAELDRQRQIEEEQANATKTAQNARRRQRLISGGQVDQLPSSYASVPMAYGQLGNTTYGTGRQLLAG